MASSDKTDRSPKSQSRKPAEPGVVSAKPVDAGVQPASLIPPSQPIESGLVGKSDKPVPPAARKAAEAPAKAAKPDSAKPPTPPANGGALQPKPAPAAQPAPVVKKTGFWPVALGGAVAAGLGAAATIWALPHAQPYLPEAWRSTQTPAIDPQALREEAVAAATESAKAEVATLRNATLDAARSAGQEAAREVVAEIQAPEGAPAEFSDQLSQQSEKIAALETALNDTQTRLKEAVSRLETAQAKAAQKQTAAAETASASTASASQLSDTTPSQTSAEQAQAASTAANSALMDEVEALRQKLNDQTARIDELSNRPQADPEAVEQVRTLANDAQNIKSEIEEAARSVQEQLDTVRAEADAATQRAQAVASVAALGAALERGGSPTEAVAQLKEAGVEVPEHLSQEDLPTLDQIQTGFDAPAREALRASLKAQSKDSGALGAVGNFLRVQSGARSIAPRDGDDPDAVLSRASVLVQQGELETALEELQLLPEAGQQAMADWTAQARAYLNAEKALNDVARSLN